MNNSNLIQSSARKRKLSSVLRDDDEYYVPKTFRKLQPTPSSHTSKDLKKAESKSSEGTSSLEALKKENESLAALCSGLNVTNKNLQEHNVALQEQLRSKGVYGETCNIAGTSQDDETAVNLGKYPLGILDVETLAELWNDVCQIPIPSCKCNAKVNTVAKKRVTQRITPLISL